MKRYRVSAGQALVLVAVMLVIMIAFAGLTIDTAKATQRQRTIQAGANASAVAGMNAVLLKKTDAGILSIMEETFKANQVTNTVRVNVGDNWGTDPDVIYWSGQYLDATGASLGSIGSGTVPLGVAHVVVKTSTDVENTFSKIAGVDTFTVSANGAAGASTCLNGLMPITFDKIYLENNLPKWYRPVPLGNPLADNSAIPSLNTTNSNSPRFRVYSKFSENQEGISGNFSWTRWNGNQSQGSAQQLGQSLTGPGNIANGFSELNPPPSSDPAAVPLLNGNIEVGDWLPADTGATAGNDVKVALNEHRDSKDFLILPIYNLTNGNGNSPGSGYRIDRFVKVRLLDYQLGGNGYFEFALLEDNVFCVSQEPNLPPPPPGAYSFKITVSESLVYTTPPTPGNNYDIAIVADYSYSMRNCWDTNTSCPPGSRRLDAATAVLRDFVHEMLVVRNSVANGGDNRLSYVTFGQKATKVVPFGPTDETLTKFKAAIGDKANPITLPNSSADGNTNIADGIANGVSYLNGARTVDKNGNKVKLAVLLLSDGLTNTFNDGPGTWTTNRWKNAPYYCGESDLDLENPLIQSTCPKQDEYPGQTISTPPVEMMVKTANDAAASKGIEFFAVVMGEQFGLTPVKMHLNRITNNYFMANNEAQLAGLVNAIAIELGEPCQEVSGGTRLAVGAQVTISFAVGGDIGTFTTNADGQIILPNKLAPGSYILKAAHTGVVAPQDKLNIPRNYTRILLEGSSTPVTSISFNMPDNDFVAPDITLVIDKDDNAKCN